jgi:hypothetical protein
MIKTILDLLKALDRQVENQRPHSSLSASSSRLKATWAACANDERTALWLKTSLEDHERRRRTASG